MFNFLKQKPNLFPFLLRFVMGWYFIVTGFGYLNMQHRWTSYDVLSRTQGPMSQFFNAMAGQPAVDYLWIFGLILIGAALLFGVVTRMAAFWGLIMMCLVYIALFPPKGFLVDNNVIYGCVFIYIYR